MYSKLSFAPFKLYIYYAQDHMILSFRVERYEKQLRLPTLLFVQWLYSLSLCTFCLSISIYFLVIMTGFYRWKGKEESFRIFSKINFCSKFFLFSVLYFHFWFTFFEIMGLSSFRGIETWKMKKNWILMFLTFKKRFGVISKTNFQNWVPNIISYKFLPSPKTGQKSWSAKDSKQHFKSS